MFASLSMWVIEFVAVLVNCSVLTWFPWRLLGVLRGWDGEQCLGMWCASLAHVQIVPLPQWQQLITGQCFKECFPAICKELWFWWTPHVRKHVVAWCFLDSLTARKWRRPGLRPSTRIRRGKWQNLPAVRKKKREFGHHRQKGNIFSVSVVGCDNDMALFGASFYWAFCSV